MIYIAVDYQGDRSIETYTFTDTGEDFQSRLSEIENYKGKIDGVKIYIDNKPADPNTSILVKTTNKGIAVRKGRQIKYPS